MYFTLPEPRTVSSDELKQHIEKRTYRRLRQLEVTSFGGRLAVSAKARSYHIRQLAERAALELVHVSKIDLSIRVEDFSQSD